MQGSTTDPLDLNKRQTCRRQYDPPPPHDGGIDYSWLPNLANQNQ